jgi:hypothetical protein
MKNFLLIFLIFLSTNSCSQNLDGLICDISDSNIVEYEHVGIGGWIGQNYRNFEELSKKANINQLKELLNHENPVVTCYSSWALIEKEYENLPEIFQILIEDNREVKTHSGCIISRDNLASEFYHRYWNSVQMSSGKDEVLFELDKIVLKLENPDWLLLKRALDNRVYNEEFKNIIYNLGFEKNYKEAIFYLCNWHRSEYNYELQLFIIEELKKTEFKGTNSSTYYKYFDELIKFKNKDVNDFILHKYRTDKPNINEIENFKSLLERNNLF